MAKPRNRENLPSLFREIAAVPDPASPPAARGPNCRRPDAPDGAAPDAERRAGRSPQAGGLADTDDLLVVFVDRTDCRWLRALKPGFRHCFAALRQGGRWLVVDPLKRRLEVRLLPPTTGFDLAAFYLAQGHRVLRGLPLGAPAGRGGALRPLTCVEAVKRLVGLESARTLTPWQLFRRLQRDPRAAFVELRPAGTDRAEPGRVAAPGPTPPRHRPRVTGGEERRNGWES